MIKHDKDLEKLLVAATDLLSQNNKFYEAEDALLKQLKEDPDNMEAGYTLGIMHAKRGDFNKALEYLEKIEQHPRGFVYLNHIRTVLGYIYALEKKYVLSKQMLIKALDFSPEDITTLSILAYVFYKAKLYEQSLKYYKKAIKNDPENAKLLNNIGFILIETGLAVEKGIEYVEKALELNPDNASYLDSLGWGYYKTGDYETAIETLRKAFELAPDALEIKDHIRQILNITGEA